MANDVELDEPLIDVFRTTNTKAIQRILDRAERNAERAAKTQRRQSKPGTKRGALTKALNGAIAAYGRSTKDRASIRQTAPDTGGRPYHFAYSHVTKGERRGRGPDGGQPGTQPAGAAGPGRGATPKPAAAGTGRKPAANTVEAAHQVYTERDSAVDKEAGPIDPSLGPVAAGTALETIPPGPEARNREAGREQDRQTPENTNEPSLAGEGPDIAGAEGRGPRRDPAQTLAYVETEIEERQGITPRASEAAAQAYIEDPSKVPTGLMGTTASFGTIGATLEDRMAFWDLVHAHESAKGGRTQSRLVLELPHEATAADRHEIVRRYTDEFRQKGIPFWASIHAPTKKNDSRNHYAHVVSTDRPMRRMIHPDTGLPAWDFTIEQTYKSSSRNKIKHHPFRQNRDPEMRDRGYVKTARARFSAVVNEVIQASDNAVRYDPRSYKDMGLDIAPMKNVARLLADKLDRRSFVVMDPEWTRRMVDAEVKAAGSAPSLISM